MIQFSVPLLHSRPTQEGAALSPRNLAASSQRLPPTSGGAFSDTLASMTTDPNSSLIVSGSQLPAPGQNPVSTKTGLNALVPTTDPVAATYATPSKPMAHWYAPNAADDAYWAQQPAAVQQLREMQSPQRDELAAKLASEGYSIDVPVMVWGWDAGITTQLREAAGYTWVPSGLQQQVSEAPGLNSPGFTPYDPLKPPPGSILVG
jgi:hypothetical protein